MEVRKESEEVVWKRAKEAGGARDFLSCWGGKTSGQPLKKKKTWLGGFVGRSRKTPNKSKDGVAITQGRF